MLRRAEEHGGEYDTLQHQTDFLEQVGPTRVRSPRAQHRRRAEGPEAYRDQEDVDTWPPKKKHANQTHHGSHQDANKRQKKHSVTRRSELGKHFFVRSVLCLNYRLGNHRLGDCDCGGRNGDEHTVNDKQPSELTFRKWFQQDPNLACGPTIRKVQNGRNSRQTRLTALTLVRVALRVPQRHGLVSAPPSRFGYWPPCSRVSAARASA